MKRLEKDEKGITLIALVVTIIVLLILAGIAISLTVGNNGIFSRAGNAANEWKRAEINERDEMHSFANTYDETVKKLGLNNGKNEKGMLKIFCDIEYPERPMSHFLEFEFDKGITWGEFFESTLSSSFRFKILKNPVIDGGLIGLKADDNDYYYALTLGEDNLEDSNEIVQEKVACWNRKIIEGTWYWTIRWKEISPDLGGAE